MPLKPDLRKRDFFVTRSLGTGHSNPHDVLRTRRALNVTGHARSPSNPSKIFDPPLIFSLERFQRDWGLKDDTIIEPGGPTEGTLELAVAATHAGGRDGMEFLRGPMSVLNRQGWRFDRNPDDTLGPVLWRDRDDNAIPLDRVRQTLARADTTKQTEGARRGIRMASAAGLGNAGASATDAALPQSMANPGFSALAERLFGRGTNSDDKSATEPVVPAQEARERGTAAGVESRPGTESATPVSSGAASQPVQIAQRGGSDPWVVKDAKGASPTNPDFDPWPTSPISRQFRFELHKGESSDRNYQSKESNGALGRYQMTPIGREEAGMTDKKGNWTGKYGIRSEKAFLNDPLAQEKAFADLMKSNEAQLRAKGVQQHLGKSIDGVKGKITVTEGGLMAAAHRKGAAAVARYFEFVKAHNWRTGGTSLPEDHQRVETRLRKFEGVKYRQP